VAVASAGPHASLHLAPDRQPHQHPTTLFFTGRMPFLLPNQQRQSTEGHDITLARSRLTNYVNSDMLSDNTVLPQWLVNGKVSSFLTAHQHIMGYKVP